MPEVSVVIPSYNCARYLPQTVASVLAQSRQDFEVLVIDDGSSDSTPELLANYREPVRYIRQANQGVAAARNRGIAESTARYVAFLDADDLWLPEKLERQLSLLQQNDSCRACFSASLVVTDDLRPVRVEQRRPDPALEDLLTQGNVVGTPSTVIVERQLLLQAGGFDPELSQCADWDMWVRLAQLTRFAYVPDPLIKYREHAGNMSRNPQLLERDSVRVLQKGFQMAGLPQLLQARRQSALARNSMVLAGTYFHARRYGHFVRCAFGAVSHDPRQLGYLLTYPLRRFTDKRRPFAAVPV